MKTFFRDLKGNKCVTYSAELDFDIAINDEYFGFMLHSNPLRSVWVDDLDYDDLQELQACTSFILVDSIKSIYMPVLNSRNTFESNQIKLQKFETAFPELANKCYTYSGL